MNSVPPIDNLRPRLTNPPTGENREEPNMTAESEPQDSQPIVCSQCRREKENWNSPCPHALKNSQSKYEIERFEEGQSAARERQKGAQP